MRKRSLHERKRWEGWIEEDYGIPLEHTLRIAQAFFSRWSHQTPCLLLLFLLSLSLTLYRFFSFTFKYLNPVHNF